MEAAEEYSARLKDRRAGLLAAGKRRTRLSYARLAAILALGLCIWFTAKGPLPFWSAAFPLIAFIALVWIQSNAERAAAGLRRAIRFYERGQARLEHRWQGAGSAGVRFVNPHHPYSGDLDLFGRGSLFELLSNARTRGGEDVLASWLLAASSFEELRLRRQAVDELRPMLDLRERLAVVGEEIEAGVDPAHLKSWAAQPPQQFPPWMKYAAIVLACAAAAALVWWFATEFIGIEARRTLAIVAIVEGAFGLSLRSRVLNILHSIEHPAGDLDRFSNILAVIEDQHFTSPRLIALRDAIRTTGDPASKQIARLRRFMELLDSRDNVFVRVFGPPLLWTTQLAMAADRWKIRSAHQIAGWLDAVAELEALASLAAYAYEHPADPFPVFEEGALFEGEELGHPLLPGDAAVRNSVVLRDPVRLIVVSGSNMSGKSTLLRTVGVNAVLALAGAPVHAKRMVISQLAIGASIRTMDSLEEGHSRFMAEILRLKQILELPQPALFLLDELLHGTNSHDRAIGAEGLVRALIARGAIGLTSTHDLSLASVADALAPAAVNVHFDDHLENGRMVFDYKMKAGVVMRSNALDLMRAVGLDV